MPEKPKILYLVTQDDLGGAARYVLSLALAFKDRADIAIAVGTDGDGWLSSEAGMADISVIRIPEMWRDIAPIHDLKAVFALRRIMIRDGWDVVHANSSKAGTLASLAAIGLAKPRIFYTAHGWVFLEPMNAVKKALYFAAEWIAARGRAGTIVLSEKERDIATRRLGISEERLRLIPHGLFGRATADLPSKAEARRVVGEPPDGLLVGTVAKFYRTKGHDTLVAALGEAALADIHFRTVLVGDGPEAASVRAAIEASPRRDSIRLAGTVAEAARLMPAFDILVIPSRKEGLPFVALEAMAAGVPIVATDVGALRETVGDAGIIVPAEDGKALSEAIARVLGDERLRRTMAENSLRRGQEAIARGRETLENTWDFYNIG